jgi:hypothetical protein
VDNPRGWPKSTVAAPADQPLQAFLVFWPAIVGLHATSCETTRAPSALLASPWGLYSLPIGTSADKGNRMKPVQISLLVIPALGVALLLAVAFFFMPPFWPR